MIKRGLTLVNAMHITAGVFMNDDEYGLNQDYEKWPEEPTPHACTSLYQHNRAGEDNPDAHLKRAAEAGRTLAAQTGCTLAAQTGCTLAAQTGCTLQVMGRDAQRWWR